MPHDHAPSDAATLHVIGVYHHIQNRFQPYGTEQQLTQVFSCWRHVTATAQETADWAYHVFNADLDELETNRARPGGEADFLTACIYRLLGLRSMSVGDVVAVTTAGTSTWLACEPIGWRRIDTPVNLTGGPLTARTIHQHTRPTP